MEADLWSSSYCISMMNPTLKKKLPSYAITSSSLPLSWRSCRSFFSSGRTNNIWQWYWWGHTWNVSQYWVQSIFQSPVTPYLRQWSAVFCMAANDVSVICSHIFLVCNRQHYSSVSFLLDTIVNRLQWRKGRYKHPYTRMATIFVLRKSW